MCGCRAQLLRLLASCRLLPGGARSAIVGWRFPPQTVAGCREDIFSCHFRGASRGLRGPWLGVTLDRGMFGLGALVALCLQGLARTVTMLRGGACAMPMGSRVRVSHLGGTQVGPDDALECRQSFL